MTTVTQTTSSTTVEFSTDDTTVTTGTDGTTVTTDAVSGTPFRSKGVWAASTSYEANDWVRYRGNIYLCVTAHTSTTSFTTGYWVRYTSGGQQLAGVESFGMAAHSYGDYGSTAEGGAGRPYFFGRMRAALGVPTGRALNASRAGSSARWGCWPVFQEFDPGSSRWPYSARIGAGLVWHGANDAVYGVDDGGWKEHSFKTGLVSEILRWRASRTYHYLDSSIAYSGTWVAVTFDDVHPTIRSGQGDGINGTQTAGSKATITTPADLGRGQSGAWVDLIFACADTGATGTVWLDGTQYGTLNIGLGAAAGTAQGHGYGADAGYASLYTFRVWVPTTYQTGSSVLTTQHSIEVRFGASVNSGWLFFNGWAIEADVPPPVLVPDVVQIANSATGLYGVMADTSVAATYSTWIDEACASILTSAGAADPSVIVCDVNDALGGTVGTWTAGTGTAYGSNKGYFLTDGIHLNHQGAAIAADVCIDALTEAVQLNIDRINTSGSYVHAEKDPLTEAPFVHRAAGTPVTVLDDFERDESEATVGGSGTETNGAFGIDSQGQLYCVDPLFPHYAVRDDFTRTSTTTLGTVEWDTAGTTRSWAAANGTWGTNGSTAYVVTSAGSGHDVATLELSTAATQSVEAQLTTSGTPDHCGLLLRYVNASNYIVVTGDSLECKAHTMVGGVLTALGTFAGAGVGTHFRAEIGTDNVLRVWNSESGAPSTTTYTISDAALLHSGSGTKVGMWVHQDATIANYAFDEFKAGTTAASTDSRTANAGTMLTWTLAADGFLGVQQGLWGSGTLLDITSGAGVVVRKSTSFNYYKLVVSYFGFWILYRVDGGVATQIASWWAGQGPGVTVYLRMSGSAFSLYDSTGTLLTRYDAASTSVTDATYSSSVHGIYHPYHDGVAKMRWRDVRWGTALTSRVPVRGDLLIDTTNAPDSVVLYGPYESASWGTGTTIGLTSTQSAEFIRDTIGTALTEGEGIDVTVSDGGDTITVALEAASESNVGGVELATAAETETGSSTTLAVHPSGGAATYVKRSLVDAKGDLLSASAADTPARLAVGTDGKVLVADTAETTGLKWGQSHFSRSNTMPSGAIMETCSRYALTTVNPLVSGRLQVVGIDLPKGVTITSITFVSSTQQLVTGTAQWFTLLDSSRVPLGVTSDDTSTAWAALTAKTLALSSPFVTTYAGYHYLGIMVAAATCPNLSGTATHAHVSALAPILTGASSTGLTNPASLPNPAGAITAGANLIYAYVS